VVDEVSRVFPEARVVRWDSDVPARVRGGSSLSDAVRSQEVDVVVGTQMIAKGLDFPGVTLVGVVNADVGLNVPDFRSGERVFQLLCQAAGRAGRGVQPGKVVVQSYDPGHYVIRSAASHDYRGFYTEEMRYRSEAGYPPFSSIVQLVYSHSDERRCRLESERVRAELASRIGGSDLRVTGPAPAFVWRLRGRYRMQLTVRGARPADVLAELSLPAGWVVDVEPAGIA
jgi:primosomal protein N' (replication factor Y)